MPAAAGTAVASAASAGASAIAIVATTAKAVVKTRAIAEAAAEAADVAAVPAAAGKASKCPEEQQTKSLNPPSNLALLCHSSEGNRSGAGQTLDCDRKERRGRDRWAQQPLPVD